MITATTYLVALPAIVLTLILAGVMKTTRNSFPGPELGLAITERWHQQLGIPLQIVGGGFVTADTIAFYSTDNPSSFQHMSRVWSPWITLDRIRSQGIAMVCLHDDIECQGDAMRVFPMHEFEVLEIEGRKKLFSEVSSQRVYYMFVPPGETEIYLNRAAHTGIDK